MLLDSVSLPNYIPTSHPWCWEFLSSLYEYILDGLWRLYWRPPDRHVLIIVNFQDLADLTSRAQQLPANADFLDAACRVYLDAIDENSLFTWCRHFNHRESLETPIGNLCNLISLRIRDTWDIRIPGHALELRAYDMWGDTVQLDKDETIAKTLDAWRPRWREFQTSVTSTQVLPRCPRRPFTLHLSCHRIVPGVILP